MELLGDELNRIRAIIRQIGDACAWLVLRQDPRIIRPLFAERTHHLTPGRGLTAPVQLIIDAHRTGQFLVLDNDLTRCLGDGDVTVVRALRPWVFPITYEMKAPGSDVALQEGDEVVINFVATLSSHPDQMALHHEFATAMGFNERNIGIRESDLERQADGMKQHAEILLAAALPSESRERREGHWSTVENVIAKAQHAGYAFDEPERGVVAPYASNRGKTPSL